jgi:hypothetical protein
VCVCVGVCVCVCVRVMLPELRHPEVGTPMSVG